jgi:hypothetical protein
MADPMAKRAKKLMESVKDDPEYLCQRFLIDIAGEICHRMEDRGYRDKFEELSAALATEAGLSRRSVNGVLDGQAHERFTLFALVAMARTVGLELTWKEREGEN